jgi:hypothetical protein
MLYDLRAPWLSDHLPFAGVRRRSMLCLSKAAYLDPKVKLYIFVFASMRT